MRKHRKEIRLPDYDYGCEGSYFLTICSHGRRPIFSQVSPGNVYELPQVRLSKIGMVIENNIRYLPVAYPEITVEKYVIMPNHVHLLITIEQGEAAQDRRDKMLIPRIMQSFKASVTKEVPAAYRPVWQSRYYDHVVRDLSDFQIKWQYIDQNPVKWVEDCYYISDCLGSNLSSDDI